MESNRTKTVVNNGTPGIVYGLGFIGAVIYFFQHAHGFWNFVLGFLEALVWPAIVVYHALEAFKIWQ
jgi:hypothetical protein